MSPIVLGLGAAVAVFVAVISTAFATRRMQAHHLKQRVRMAPHEGPSKTAIAVAVGLVLLLVVGLTNPKLLLLVGLTIVVALVGMRRYRVHAEVSAYEANLPIALEAIARSMRAGAGLLQALRETSSDIPGPVAGDLRRVVMEVDRGLSMATALVNWHLRRPLHGVRTATSSLALALATGAAHAQVIDRVAVGVRQELNARSSARNHATQARASAVALTFLPVLFTGPLLIGDQQVRDFLLGSWLGLSVLIVGLVLDGLGAWWMARLVRRVSE